MLRPGPRSCAALAVLLAACGDPSAPAGPGPVSCPFTTAQQSLVVLGCGATPPGPWTAEVAVHGARAYTTTYNFSATGPDAGNVVNVWDVRGSNPLLVDTLRIPGAVARTSDVSIADDGSIMVVSTEPAGTIAIYALDGSARPALLTLWSVPGVGSSGIHTAKLARVDGRLHLFAQSTATSPGVAIIDMSNPAVPQVVGRIAAANYIHDVYVRGGLLFAADWHAGVAIWDIGGGGRGGSVSAPVLVSRAATLGGSVHNVWWFHDPSAPAGTNGARYIFVGQEGPGGIVGATSSGDLHVVDISDLAAPREVAIYHVADAGAHNFSMDEARGILYAAFYNGGVRALDVRGDLSACAPSERIGALCDLRLMGRERAFALSSGGAFIWGVQFAGDAVYASDMYHGIWKLQPVVR